MKMQRTETKQEAVQTNREVRNSCEGLRRESISSIVSDKTSRRDKVSQALIHGPSAGESQHEELVDMDFDDPDLF